jgi:hypothetical protein
MAAAVGTVSAAVGAMKAAVGTTVAAVSAMAAVVGAMAAAVGTVARTERLWTPQVRRSRGPQETHAVCGPIVKHVNGRYKVFLSL